MNISCTLVLFTLASLFTSGCSSTQATYFRKHGATVNDERIAWGLCGGSFFENGALQPIQSDKVLECMKRNDYQTINEYYEETLVAWIKEDSAKEVFWDYSDLKECGAHNTVKGVCTHSLFILRSEFSKVSRCMKQKGYVAAIPRYKVGVRIFENLSEVDKNYCTYLTPKNRKGGVSLGNWRWEPGD